MYIYTYQMCVFLYHIYSTWPAHRAQKGDGRALALELLACLTPAPSDCRVQEAIRIRLQMRHTLTASVLLQEARRQRGGGAGGAYKVGAVVGLE